MFSTRTDDVYKLPDNLPIPKDDGACDHLLYKKIPELLLESTNGTLIDLSKINKPLVLFCYPRTGRPDKNPPAGWNEIPGARGCTPQICAFRDLHYEFIKHNVIVFGLSTQDSSYQREMQQRLNLPFQILSDEKLEFTKKLTLPTFNVDNMTLIKRLTLIVDKHGVIQKIFYPVFPSDINASESIKWIKNNLTFLGKNSPTSTFKS
ncbi:MAG: peroxiredoxin [Bacteroidia bacterium]|nr:MAG: peroxiredoxin [Bacteroidia bacterium]